MTETRRDNTTQTYRRQINQGINISETLREFLIAAELIEECYTGYEINERCLFDQFDEKLNEEYSDDYIGDDNLFSVILKDVKSIMNFQMETLTMSLIRTKRIICKNITRFRKDFKITNFYRMKDSGPFSCYVTLSYLKPYWIVSSLNDFISGERKLKLFDEKKKSDVLLWVRLT